MSLGLATTLKRTAMKPRPRCCRYCKVRLEKVGAVLHDDCVEPWYVAHKAKQAEKKAKQDRVQTRAQLEALKGVPVLKNEAQAAFNSFVRARDRDKGCFVCGRPFDQSIKGRALHAGHVRSRGAADHLRYHEDNCLGECEGCNGPRGAKPHEIEAGAIRRIGQERFDALKNDNSTRKWTREELRAIRDTYRARARELEKARTT